MRREPVEVVVGEDVLKGRELVRDRLDLGQLLRVLAHDPDSFRVREQVADVVGRARGVDGDSDCADVREGEVDERPLEAVSREEREVVALAHAPGEEAVRVVADSLVGLRPAHFTPAAVVLDQVGGCLPPGRDGVAPQAGDRPALAGGTRRLGRGRGLRHLGRAY